MQTATLTYSLSGTDAGLFTIDPATGVVSFNEAPDAENPDDANGDNIYDIIVTASDNTGGTPDTTQAVAITVTGVNEDAPSFTSDATARVAENQTAAYTAIATDADGDSLRYSLSGTDAALFTINETTGEVSFIAPPDFENPDDAGRNNVYDITVTASDDTNDTNHDVAITVTNVNDNTPLFTSPDSADVEENQTLAYTAMATDGDGDTLTYSLSGTDAALFTINETTGEVSFIAPPDFENPDDAGRNNVYDITVTASDNTGGTPDTNQAVAITVTNVNEDAPSFTSPDSASVAENQTVAYTAAATDGDGDPLTYGLSGTDADLFMIDPATGVVSFITPPDFEDPGDAGGNNIYNITVTASDGDNSTDHNVAITVTNENDNDPIFTSDASASVAENQPTDSVVYTAQATDEDGDNLTYSLSGTDAARFTIDPATGAVRFIASPDFENPDDAGGNNVYDITVTASDDTNDTNHAVAITVTNINDNSPSFTSDTSVNVAENQTAAYTPIAADADGDPLTYSLSGTDAALFTINEMTGAVRFMAAPDFEAPGDNGGDNVYDITVTASDGDNSTDHNVAITVTNENDNDPIFTSDATADVAENQTEAYTAIAADADGDDLSYSLSGTDAALFTIDPNTGLVSFIAAPDFEMPGDDGGDNVYDITVTASDDTNDTDHNVAITVTDEYDLIDLSTLDGSNGFTLAGTDANDFAGTSVSSAGDVNGDGYDDLIIGAIGGGGSGETYVVYGGATGTQGVLALSMLDGTNGFILTGTDANDRFGFSVSSAGDVNGDGYDDLIIGTDRVGSDAGETYVIYGGANAPGTDGELTLSDLDGTNGFILSGIEADDYSGRAVSSAGDVNGDGYDDLIIGAFRADPGGNSNAGETYLVYGGATGTDLVLNRSTLNGTNGFTLTGVDRDDRSGNAVSSAGDVNGDGYDDLIIGAYGAGNFSGETYVVYGGASAPGTGGVLDLSPSTLNGANGFTLTGLDVYDQSGISVSSAGDVNGDGYDDLIIGANRADPRENSAAGETYVVYGGANAPGTGGVLDLSPATLNGANGFTLTGADAGDQSGTSVSSAGDVNGDGYGDLIIGANAADPAGEQGAGETYVVYGGASAPGTEGILALSDLDGTNGFVLNGNDADDQSGLSVSSAGDVNGDGYDDLIIGALRADPGGVSEAGEAYLVYGGATGTESTVPITAQGTAAADNFTGNAGADSFTGIAAGDVVRGGAGDDRIGVTSPDFADIDGGTGRDTLVLEGSNLSLDLRGAGNGGVDSVEVVDLTGSGANTLLLDPLAVFNLTEERAGGIATLDVLGDGNDTVDLRGSNFSSNETVTEDETTYAVYRDGNVAVRVQMGVQALTAPPVFTSDATVSVAENQTEAYTATATDEDTDTLTYGLSGTDAALFTIDPATGVVSFIAAPDFEAPGDNDRDNVYDITVTASDNTNQTDHDVAITVTNENDNAPMFTSAATANVAENQAAVVYTAQATDADGDDPTYSLSGTDAGLFTIDPATGEVRFREAPDFEMPGDADDNNVYDITVTASDGDNSIDHNVAITVTDVNDLPLSTLNGTNGFTLNGIDPNDRSGISVSSAGDVNGDGYDDLIIGASGGDPGGDSNAGETYVIYGGPGAPGTEGMLTLSDLDGTNGFVLNRVEAGDYSGFSVSSAGDVNGDGYDDLIIGAFGADPGEHSNAGETYVVYGGANAPGTGGVLNLSPATLDGTNGFILSGIDAGDYSGRAVSSAGDLNGDGYDDLIIGAGRADGTAPDGMRLNDVGETYVVYGGAGAPGTGGVLNLSMLDGSNGFTLTGTNANDNSGASVSSVGDVNGDGYDDLIVGAAVVEETYVVYGGAGAPGTGGVLALSMLDGTNGFTLNGIDANDNSGISVSSAGDVNGDGYDDLIIGASGGDPGGDSNAGETYVVYGGARAPGTDGVLALSDLDGANGFILSGIDAGDYSGRAVSSAGDVNGDGYDDLIIGASSADLGGADRAGETYLVYGGATATGRVLDLSMLDRTQGFILNGVDASDYSGLAVSSAGDVNGDGYDDLIIGAWGADPGAVAGAGETYVVYGGATGTESTTPITAQGTAGADNFTGNGGADSFTGIATDDVVRGGAGDDRISVTSPDFADIDGGTGRDTLVLDGSNLSLDITGPGNGGVDSVEVVDLSGTGGNTLALDALAVFDLTEERAGGIATLDVLGDADDTVELNNSNFTPNGMVTEDGTTYAVYRDGNAEVRVQTGVQVQIPAAPVFTSDAAVNVPENQTVAYEAQATDEDSDTLSYRLSGTDAALFTIDATTGVVSFAVPPDFEIPGDAGGDNVYDITVTASDDSNETDHDVAITVTNENDNDPMFTSAATANVAENQAAVVYTAQATDADGDDPAYSLSGTDADLFTIDPATGEVRFREAPDFEMPGDADDNNVYDITVTASDGDNSTDHNVAITVTDVNDNDPAFNSPATVNVAENQTVAYTAMAADVDAGDTVSYSLSGGADAALFTIDATTGVVSFMEAPDFEMPGDDDDNNTYDITVTASDGTNDISQAVAITVTNENDNNPAFTSPDSASVVENQSADTVVYTAMAMDADGDTLIYGLAGTDAALFTIDPNTGEVRFMAPPDFENPGDDGDDNVYDITVTATDGDHTTNHAVAITVTDEYDPVELGTLNGANGFTLNGFSNEMAGGSVSSAGDVNGDGYDDLIIGANQADPGRNSNAGATYVVYGGASAPGAGGVLALSDLDGSNGFVLNGIEANDNSGISVSSAGDVNGDGYADLLIGARTADRTAPDGMLLADVGATYVVYGGASVPGTGSVLELSDLDGSNGFTLSGVAASDFAGYSVSSAGDVNGDGYDDLIIGADQADPGGSASGEAYVVYGGATGSDLVLDRSTLDGTNGFTLTGADAFDRAGFSVSSAGDVNGDGYDDLLIGAYRADLNGESSGETYVIYGGADAPGAGGVLALSPSMLDGVNGFIVTGTAVYDYAGTSVSSAGDVNGDGYDDLIIGANSADPGGASRVGESYVVYGGPASTGGRVNLADLDGTNGLRLPGIDRDDLSGSSVSSAGDVNGDGYDDLIIGANGADPGGKTSAGESYVVYGASAPGTGGVLALSALDGTNGLILNGVDRFDTSGRSVSSAGDVNGDGYDDLIIGARGGNSSAGASYVVYGGATGTESTVSITAQGTAGADNFTGNAGADSFTGIATGDVVRGGAGDDRISITSPDFADIDGGTGRDTLVLAGADLSLDLTGPGNGGVDSVEVVDLSGSGANTLVLDALAVFDLTEERAGGIATLDVLGDANDRVELRDNTFTLNRTVTEDDTTYNVYRDGNVAVRVQAGVQVQIPVAPVFSSDVTASVAENQSADSVVYTAMAMDGNGDALIYGLAGTDAALFTIDATTGEVRFMAPPDFEIPGDADDNNVYDITVTASDGYATTNHDVAITVTDVDDGSVERNEIDEDGNGTIDRVEIYTLDVNGNRTRTDFDDDNDSTIDRRESYTLDASGNRTRIEFDDNADGTTDRVETYVYVNGNLVRANFDIQADGLVDRSELYFYDVNGNRIRIEFDDDADGISDRVERYDADGNLIQQDFDDDDDGTFDRRETYTLNGTGNRVRTDFDDDGDGNINRAEFDDDADSAVDRRESYTLDGSGNRTRTEFDDNADGNTDRTETYTLDANGNRTRTDFDDDANGTVERSETYTVDATGNRTRTDFDDDNDGNTDRSEHYDVTGNVIRQDFDDNDDGTVDRVERYTLNATGNRTRTDFDDDNDGTTDRTEFDLNADGNIERFESFDASGRLTKVELDSLEDGTVDRIDYTWYPEDTPDSYRRDEDTDGDGDLDQVQYDGDFDYSEDFPNHAGLEVVRMSLVGGGEGLTDLSIQRDFVFAGNTDPVSPVRIEGGAVDTLRFGMDRFTEGDRVDFEGESYRSFAADDGSWSFIVNADVTLVDLPPDTGNAPVFTSGASATVVENQIAAYIAQATDADGDPLTYSLSGTDAALFTIDATTGEVSFMTAPDFENPGDNGGDNVYDITITVSDGLNDVTQSVAITVTDDNFNLSMLDGTNGFTLNGIDGGDESGLSVSSAGDVNGDGYDDLIIGARGGDPNGNGSGETYVVYGGASVPGADGALPLSALDGSNGFILNGIDSDDRSGTSVSSAGDVNGDGYDDLIIGADRADPGGTNSGESYVVYGGANAPGTDGVLTLSALDGSNGFILTGFETRSYSSSSVSSAGDVNGDGYDDLIIGAYRGGRMAGAGVLGQSYVVYGGESAPGIRGVLALSALDGSNGFALTGRAASDYSGISVSSAGDVNGDGYDDLIIGAFGADNFSGESYVVYGGATGTNISLNRSTLNGTNGFTLIGTDGGDRSGASVSSAGDVNGDGYDDLIIGADRADPNGNSSGETYVVYGGARAPGTGGVLNLSALNGANGFILNGIDSNDSSGVSVSSATAAPAGTPWCWTHQTCPSTRGIWAMRAWTVWKS